MVDAFTRHCQVENLTPLRVTIVGGPGSRLSLAPLERRRVEEGTAARFDRECLANDGRVRITDEPVVDVESKLGLLLVAGVVGAVIGFGAANPYVWAAVGLAFVLIVAGFVVFVRSKWWEAWLWARQTLSLVTVVVVGVGLPTAAIWFGTDIGATVAGMADDPAGPPWGLTSQAVVGRGLQWLAIVTASLVPALLYYLFDRQQLRTLHDRFVVHAFRLDGSLRTVYDLEARYGAQIEESYGSEQHRRGGGRLAGGRRFPVVLASVLVTMGWTFALLRPDVTAAQLDDGSVALWQMFLPAPSIVAFAFMGAYVFTLEVVVRGYLRGDLRPKIYSRVSVRLITVVAVAFVLDAVAGTATYGVEWLVVAFAAGFFPDWALQILLERVQELPFGAGRRPLSLRQGTPLTELEEIDVFDRSTLSDEGITNVEAFAHHDIIDVMLQTRIPAARIIDWTDQAIVYLYAHKQLAPGGGAAGEGPTLLDRLRALGLRTATQVVAVHRRAEETAAEAAAPKADALLAAVAPEVATTGDVAVAPGGDRAVAVLAPEPEPEAPAAVGVASGDGQGRADGERPAASPGATGSPEWREDVCAWLDAGPFDRDALHDLLGLSGTRRPSQLDTLVAGMSGEEWLAAIGRWRRIGPHPVAEELTIACPAPPTAGEVPGPAPGDGSQPESGA